jgi:hypothetical protein
MHNSSFHGGEEKSRISGMLHHMVRWSETDVSESSITHILERIVLLDFIHRLVSQENKQN